MANGGGPSTRPAEAADQSQESVRLVPIKSQGSNETIHMHNSSREELQALLLRTTQALDKIVTIRESMEEFVDFSQFTSVPRTSSSNRSGRSNLQRHSSEEIPVAGGAPNATRTTVASSYDSTTGSSGSEDPLRSTNSTNSTNSDEETSGDVPSELLTGHPRRNGSLTRLDESESENDLDDDLDDFRIQNDGSEGSIEGSDRMSEFISSDLSTFKAERLERMTRLEVSYHDGLPREFFNALGRFLYSHVEVKTRHSKFNFYKDAFVGADAVRELVVCGFCEDLPNALRIGNVLVRLGLIQHVSRTDDQLHNTKDNFYRFTRTIEQTIDEVEESVGERQSHQRMSINAMTQRESMLSREASATIQYDFSKASDEVHALVAEEVLPVISRVLHKILERKNKLLQYKGFDACFLGSEAVGTLRELRLATSVVDAVLIGQSLLDDGMVEPIPASVTTFQDKYIFYRLV